MSSSSRPSSISQKAPSTRRCIKTELFELLLHDSFGQKAPSTRRCVKTKLPAGCTTTLPVRKHPAPEGALRLFVQLPWLGLFLVRKHPAPEGALRLRHRLLIADGKPHQKAPSTRRCIKTLPTLSASHVRMTGQKAPSTRRCIKTDYPPRLLFQDAESEGIPHQKVY